MQTVSENLAAMADSLCALLDDLFPTNIRLRDMNRGGGVVITGPSHVFPSLDDDQRRIRSRLADELGHFLAIVDTMLNSQPKATVRKIEAAKRTLTSIADQKRVNVSSTDAAKSGARKAFDTLLSLVSDLHDDSEDQVLFVPDTNALLSSPALESWTFDEFDAFQLVLVPSVLSELDELKVAHRNPDVRDKANDLIRQVKEYRRRGKLTSGVPVVKGKVTLRALAVEPRVEGSLPWLDPGVADDRILASCVEVMRAHPRSVVALVTGDINLQNKAEFALVPFLEPPG